MDEAMKKVVGKVAPTRIIRRLTQIIAFLLMPGLFIDSFYAMKTIYQAVLTGSVSFAIISQPILILLVTFPLTIVMGRFFCGFFCSFGAMGDLLWFLSQKTIHSKFRVSERIDAMLKWVKYGILIFIVIVFWTLDAFTLSSFSSPWTVFGMYTSIGNLPAATTLVSLGGVLLLLIMVGSLFIERFFCRYLCPLGAVYAILSKLRLFHITKKRDHCGACRICTNNCSMGISLYEYDKVTSGECINCLACVEHCPRKNVATNPKPAVACVLSAVAVSGLYYAGTIAENNANTVLAESSYSSSTTDSTSNSSIESTTASPSASSSSDSQAFTDGTYTGSGTGYRGTTNVSVVVSGGNITGITITSFADDSQYFNRAKSTVISEIIQNQSVNVTAVSGATFSSNGIMAAVANALGVSYTNTNSSSSSNKKR